MYDNLKEVEIEGERSKKAAFAELVKRKQIESEVAEAFARVRIHVVFFCLFCFLRMVQKNICHNVTILLNDLL